MRVVPERCSRSGGFASTVANGKAVFEGPPEFDQCERGPRRGAGTPRQPRPESRPGRVEAACLIDPDPTIAFALKTTIATLCEPYHNGNGEGLAVSYLTARDLVAPLFPRQVAGTLIELFGLRSGEWWFGRTQRTMGTNYGAPGHARSSWPRLSWEAPGESGCPRCRRARSWCR